MATDTVPLTLHDGFAASGIARQRSNHGRVCQATTWHGSHERDNCVCLRFGEWVAGHAGIGHTIADDADQVIVRAGGLEGCLAEIDADDPVSVLAMTASATVFIQLGAGVDFRLRVAVLLRENRRSESQ
jgi:hypothetical protein